MVTGTETNSGAATSAEETQKATETAATAAASAEFQYTYDKLPEF